MSWDDRRTTGVVVSAARHEAHSDDAKHRHDDASHSTQAVRRVGRWVPIAVAGAVVLVAGVGAAVALGGGDDEKRTRVSGPAKPGSPPSKTASAAAAPTVDADTGLPLVPTKETVRYVATTRCVKVSKLTVGGQCGPGFQVMLECPGGACTLGFVFGPEFDRESIRSAGRRSVRFTFRAGQPSFRFAGTIKEDCPQAVRASGTRAADGTYTMSFVQRFSASTRNAGGAVIRCEYSPETYSGTLGPVTQ